MRPVALPKTWSQNYNAGSGNKADQFIIVFNALGHQFRAARQKSGAVGRMGGDGNQSGAAAGSTHAGHQGGTAKAFVPSDYQNMAKVAFVGIT